ncbi:hypothetical protein [Pollutimonas sp. M17]|uniref:hypothetical protein n=1 Tax=Pollutimonas sp. M17 TaxID=2962065 RepID=UPI0021F4F810|nr:hypothetical protein [Pollutimonas sp. M17]UYO92426.1 hypothetical protein OEG81_10895 [Pollutimonas sp. M17]
MDDKKTAALEKILGIPFFGDLPDNGLKVRRNLLACSSISTLLVLSNAKFDPNPTVFGFKFNDVPGELVPISLFVFCLYFFLHFLSYAVEAFLEWRIRLTGQIAPRYANNDILTIGDPNSDNSLDSRQSTLYSWWLQHIPRFQAISDRFAEMDNLRATNTVITESPTEIELRLLKASVESLDLHVPRITKSLERFDNWFQLSFRVQSLRWIILDLTLPLALGLMALFLLLTRIVPAC